MKEWRRHLRGTGCAPREASGTSRAALCGLGAHARTRLIQRPVPPQKVPPKKRRDVASVSLGVQHRERLKSCQIECDLQSATLRGERRRSKLLGLPFLLRVNASGPAGTCRRSIPSGTPQFTQPGLNAIKEGLHSPGARMQKETPIRS